MRIARVIGILTLNRPLRDFPHGRFLIAEALDAHSMTEDSNGRRKTAMPESLIVFDQLGAGVGQTIAVSEGREAAMPFHPRKVPVDAYCAAILDNLEWEGQTILNANQTEVAA